jgi:hypothetical protein
VRSLLLNMVVALQVLGLWASPSVQLMFASNFTYVGAFRDANPNNDPTNNCMGCFPDTLMGNGMSLWPAHGSFIISNLYHCVMEEVAPGTLYTGTSSDSSLLTRATTLQAPVCAYNGGTAMDGNPSNGWGYTSATLRGTTDLVLMGAQDYDASQSQSLDAWVWPQTFSNGGATGAWKVGNESFGGSTAGPAAGWSIHIPSAWQSRFGNHDTLIGGCCRSVIGRTSLGPSVTAVTMADVGVTVPPTSKMVLGYPESHATLGPWSGQGTTYFDVVTHIQGAIWPQGSRSILFFGNRGTPGNFAYGPGTVVDDANSFGQGHNSPANQCSVWGVTNPNVPTTAPYQGLCNVRPSLPANFGGQPCSPLACYYDNGGNPYGSFIWCYDPAAPSEGAHGYPYHGFVWAYDANDLAAVYSGATANYWTPVPYTGWIFNTMNGFPFPFMSPTNDGCVGVGIDQTAQNIIIPELGFDRLGGLPTGQPDYSVFHYTLPSAPVPTPLTWLASLLPNHRFWNDAKPVDLVTQLFGGRR